MKRALWLTLATLVAAPGFAFAADLPPSTQPYYKAPPMAPPSWTGCYINGGGGFGVFTANQAFNGGLVAGPQDNGGQGWMALGGGGCDYQFPLSNWNIVVGAFGDFDFTDYRGTIGAGGITGDQTQNWAWAGGLRAGILAAPNVLIYTNGGYTGARLNSVNFSNADTLPAQTLNGWFLGGGVETSLNWIMSGLFLRTEYRYSCYQATNNQLVTTAAGAPTGIGFNTNLNSQAVFTQLVWRFNWSGAWHP